MFEYVRAQNGRVQFLPPKERRVKLLKLYVITVWTITYGVLFISTSPTSSATLLTLSVNSSDYA
jgi:hypothetical protein